MPDPRMRTWAEISLDNLSHNYNAIKTALPDGCKIMGIVKANAYGHGAIPVAMRLCELGCELLAVACLSEAVELRDAGINTPILILGPEPPINAPIAAEQNCAITIGDIAAAREISRLLTDKTSIAGEPSKFLPLSAHIKLDTGMCRTGFSILGGEDISQIAELFSLPNINIDGIYTHFAVSDIFDDPFTDTQLERFISACEKIEKLTGRRIKNKHCANSGAVINYIGKLSNEHKITIFQKENIYLDFVRPGISLYGSYPGINRGNIELLPVMTLKSRVAAIYTRRAGETISYGRTYTLSRDSRIAVLPIGYGDGLPRILSNNLTVSFNDDANNSHESSKTYKKNSAPQIGRICMDMCMLDVTELPDINIGSVATIFGIGGNCAETLANSAGTISYELFCGITNRVPRIHI